MKIRDITAEEFARLHYETLTRLAPTFVLGGWKLTGVWDDLPPVLKNLYVSVARVMLNDLEAG